MAGPKSRNYNYNHNRSMVQINYVTFELDPEELEVVAIDSKRSIEIDESAPKSDIGEIYMRDPCYIVPDGEVGQQAFA